MAQQGELKLRVALEGGREAAQELRQVEQANSGLAKATGKQAQQASLEMERAAAAAARAQEREARKAEAAAERLALTQEREARKAQAAAERAARATSQTQEREARKAQAEIERAARAAALTQEREARRAQAEIERAARASARAQQKEINQTTAAMRSLPAQFTDIAVSLQGGQSPLTVLFQQGGQIKDMFGGVGAATKALGGYALGLVTPMSVAGAAIGAVALAAYAGGREATVLAQSLIASGHAAGMTAGQLQVMAASAAQSAGVSRGAVSAAVAELVSQGRVGKEVLSDASLAAVAWAKATGVAVSDIAQDFAALAKDPMGATLKLNEAMNFLTVSTYEQIKALLDKGQHTEAATLAQRVYADTLAERAPQMLEQLGLMERGWQAVKSAIGGVVDVMKNFGRSGMEEMHLGELRGRIDSLKFAMEKAPTSWKKEEMRQQLNGLYQEELKLVAVVEKRQTEAQTAATQAKQVQARVTFDEIAKGHASEEARLKAELERIRTVGLEAGKSEAEIAKLQEAARSKANAKTAQDAKRMGQVADQLAQQSAAHERSMRRLVDADMLASVRDRVARSVLTQEQGIAEVARIEREAALAQAAEFDALAKSTKDPVKRDKAVKDAALARREALNVERQAERERAALREKEFQAYQGLVNQAVAEEMKRADALRETAQALGLQTEQARSSGVVIDGIATILAREEAARYAVAAATTEQSIAAALARGAGEQEIGALRTQLELLQRLAQEKAGVASASGLADLRQAGLDQTKRLFGQSDPFEAWGQTLRDTLGQAGDGLARLVSGMGQLTAGAQEYAREMAIIKELRERGDERDRQTADENEIKLIKKTEAAQVSAYASMASAAKGYFGKQTAAYKVLHAAEVALRTYQLVSAVQANAKEIAAIGAKVAAWVTGEMSMTGAAAAGAASRAGASLLEGQAAAAAGVANQAKGDPYSAFPRMAAMAALMAALGFAVRGGRGSAPVVTNTGTGTVFGDSDAKSESFGNSLKILNRTQDEALIYSRSMVASLRSIEYALAGATNIYLRTGGVSGLTGGIATGKLDTGLSSALGSIGGLLTPLGGGLLKGLATALFGKKVSIVGSGITAGAQSLASILDGGFQGGYYANVNTKKKAFGITYSNKTSTQTSDMDPALERQITAIFEGVGASVSVAAELLGQDMAAINQRLSSYVVSIGHVDLQGLDGKGVAERLSAVFGAQADKIAEAVIPGFERLRQVSEGYYETLTRVANQYESVNLYLARFGDALGTVGIEGAISADALVRVFGGLDEYTGAAKQYYQDFYSESERTQRTGVELGQAFARLNLALPTTLTGYRDLVNAQDLSTAAGRDTYAMLLALGPAFAHVTNAAEAARKAIADERSGLQDQLDQLMGNTAALRARELAALDVSNRALQERIWALQDEKEAADAANSAGGRIVDWVAKLDGSALGLATAAQRASTGRLQYGAQLALARAGDKTALESITSTAGDYLQAARDSAGNQMEYAIQLAQVKSDLALLPAARSYMEQLTAEQLRTMVDSRDGIMALKALMTDLVQVNLEQAATLASTTGASARRTEDLLRFLERLEADGVFGSGS